MKMEKSSQAANKVEIDKNSSPDDISLSSSVSTSPPRERGARTQLATASARERFAAANVASKRVPAAQAATFGFEVHHLALK